MNLETTPTAVSVYIDRARVTRSGTLSLETGLQRVEMGDLPLSLDPESVRASASGTARARLLGLEVKRAYFEETPAGRVRQLEEQVEALQDEQMAMEARIEQIKYSRDSLESLFTHTDIFATGLAGGETDLEKHLALLDGLRERGNQLDAERIELEVQERSIQRRLDKAKAELEQSRSARPRSRNAVLLEVDVRQAGDLTIQLVYVVTGASWKPLYDLRLEENQGKATLEVGYLAQVIQNSGEDWQDVELTLSTARPALSSRLPELTPWYIEPARPVPPPAPKERAVFAPQAAPMRAAAASGAVSDEELQMMPAMMEEAVASVNSSGAAVTYQLPGKAGIPSDGAPHKVTVARFPLEPKLDHVSAPKLVEAVYRRAKAQNDSPYTLLAGSSNLFLGEEFIGATNIDLTPPNGEIELYLGVDDRLPVERELKRREVDKTLVSGRRRIRYGYEIRVENRAAEPVHLKLRDQLPVARHEDIKIRLEAADPKPSEQDSLNRLTWELTLASQEKKTVRFEFSVEYPQNQQVWGLP